MSEEKSKIRELLEAKGIKYQWLEHKAVFTVEEMDEAGISQKGNICKNLFLRDAKGKNHFLVVMPAEKRGDLVSLASKIHSTKLSFASAERLSKYLGVPQGSVSPFAVLNDTENDVAVIFDNDLKKTGIVGVHPNDNTASVWLPLSDLEKIITEHGNNISFVTL